jgi:hypothetical protein
MNVARKRVDITVGANEQRAGDIMAQLRLLRVRSCCVEHFERDTSGGQPARDVSQVGHSFSGVGNLDRARSVVADGSARIASDARHELVVELEATDRKIEKQRVSILGLRIWREHAGRRLRGAHSRQPVVDDLNRCAAAGQFVRHRASHDSSADDQNVRGTG